MNELELENDAIDRAKRGVVTKKEEILVHHDLVKLDTKRIRANLNTKSEKVYGLENRKEQLRISIMEREKEVEVHQDVLKNKLRIAEEERHKAALELSERKTRIFNLKMKFDTVQGRMKQEGEEQKSH